MPALGAPVVQEGDRLAVALALPEEAPETSLSDEEVRVLGAVGPAKGVETLFEERLRLVELSGRDLEVSERVDATHRLEMVGAELLPHQVDCLAKDRLRVGVPLAEHHEGAEVAQGVAGIGAVRHAAPSGLEKFSEQLLSFGVVALARQRYRQVVSLGHDVRVVLSEYREIALENVSDESLGLRHLPLVREAGSKLRLCASDTQLSVFEGVEDL